MQKDIKTSIWNMEVNQLDKWEQLNFEAVTLAKAHLQYGLLP
jgi:hypothetical protein